MDVDPETTESSDRARELTDGVAGTTPTQSFPAGLLNGRYLLGAELGSGGFAVTYLAEDLDVARRKVVVKILHERRSRDSWSVAKFQSEMEALARIDHPNVVSVLDFGHSADGKPFLVMQYVRGRSLRELIPREGLALADVAQILKQTGRALTVVHDAGICHRDLKPENILIQRDANGEQQVKLIDFGIASIREDGESAVQSTVAGTYSYMAPEQFHGRSSFSTDIYQMGVVAFELVTGIKPFRAASATGVILQHMEGLRVLPRNLRPELPEAAEAAILKAMSPQPEDRYQHARDFGDEVAAILLTSGPESAAWIKSPSSVVGRSSTLTSPPANIRRIWLWFVLALVAFIAIVTTAFFLWRSANAGPQSVAVLPFDNRTGDPNLAYLTDGVTEALINDLSHIPSLRVIARGSVSKYRGSKMDARTAGKELGVERVIDGSISRNGDQFYLDTELLDVRSGVRVWGNAYSAKISSLADVLQQFSNEATDQLRLKLSGTLKDRLKRQYAVGSEAYQQYLKGRFYLNKRTAADFQEAIQYFNKAIAADPEYAPAYSGLAASYAVMASFGSALGGAIPAESLEQSRHAAKRALQLDGTLAEAYAARGFVEMQADYQWETAKRDFRTSIELDPSSPDAHEFYAFDLGSAGSFEDAIRELNVAAELAPNSPGVHMAQSLILYMARRYEASLNNLRIFMKTPVEQGISADVLAENYWAQSEPLPALAAIRRIPADFTPHFRIPLLAAAYARAGQTEEAKGILNSYVVQPEVSWWYYLALAHLGLHQTDEALNDLEHAYQQRYMDVIWYPVDPMLQELRSNPRFRAILLRTGRKAN